MTSSQGAQALLAMDPTAVDGDSTEQYEFVSEGLAKAGAILDTNAIRGSRSHAKERTRVGPYTVAGPIVLNPSPLDLAGLLPRILGTAAAGDVFALAETLPDFEVMIARVAKDFRYTGCKVNKATFTGTSGGFLVLTLDIIGKTEGVEAAGTLLAYDIGIGGAAGDAPYIFEEGVLVLTTDKTIPMLDFELVIDNVLDPRFANSLTAGLITPQDRNITLRATVPYSTANEVALYGQTTGLPGSLTFTNGSMSAAFAFANLQVPDNSPIVTGKTEITLGLEMTARMSSTTKELIVTNDSTA